MKLTWETRLVANDAWASTKIKCYCTPKPYALIHPQHTQRSTRFWTPSMYSTTKVGSVGHASTDVSIFVVHGQATWTSLLPHRIKQVCGLGTIVERRLIFLRTTLRVEWNWSHWVEFYYVCFKEKYTSILQHTQFRKTIIHNHPRPI